MIEGVLAVAVQKRALTFEFQRSVSGTVPQIMEVVVTPLSTPNAPNDNATLVGGAQTQTILLTNDVNTCVFQLVPTDSADLTARVTYRAAWREKYMGIQNTQDFVMPDFDVAFDDLANLSLIVGHETYLQWSDRGNPDGVAALNSAGQVVDSGGNPVSGSGDATTVQGNLSAEIVARQQADNNVRNIALAYTNDQITQVYATAAANLNNAVQTLEAADLTERSARQSAVNTLNSVLATQQASLNTAVATIDSQIDAVTTQLGTKADLVNGKIPSAQLPQISLGHAVTVADEAGMLALSDTDVQPGDFAIRPDGIYFLNVLPVNQLSSWVRFNAGGAVLSVNGHVGAVVLAAADVGARAAGVALNQSEVTGLTAALGSKVDVSVTNAIAARVSTLEGDTTIVRTSGGLVPKALMPADAAFINTSNLLTKKDGTVINTGSGGTIEITDVDGLIAALAGKVNTTDPALTNQRIPTAHAASHATGGSDPITAASIGARALSVALVVSDITGLQAALDAKADSSVTGRVTSLETRVTTLEDTGGTGGGTGGASAESVSYHGSGVTTDLSTVAVHSPFGKAASDGHLYYDPAGAVIGEAVWPYLTPNGHLKFIARNETNPTDPALATQAEVDTLTTTVSGKANQTDLDTTNAAVGTKAAASQLSTLQAQVDNKADTSALNSLTDTVGTKANAADVTTGLNAKANASDLTALTTTVGTKAAASDLTALTTRVTSAETTLGNKANTTDLAAKANASDLTALTTTVGTKAAQTDLTALTGRVTTAEGTLTTKADLVGGKVPTAQIPAIATHETYSVANRAAMLALTTSQVQIGDACIITATADQGTYTLVNSDPTQFSSWMFNQVPGAPVSSVNGYTGVVVLGPADVGARSSGVAINQSEVTGLPAALAAKANATDLTAGLAGKTSPTDVQALITDAAQGKLTVDYVATTNLASLSAPQSVDGTVVSAGKRVLVTAQSSSIANGIYTVNTGAWTRVADMAAGSYFVTGSLVVVKSGAANANSVYQQTSASGLVGTNANNWSKILTATPPPAYTAVNGVGLSGTQFTGQVVSGGGIQAVSGGFQLDPNLACRKVPFAVPGGNAVVTLNHNLNNSDVNVAIRDSTGAAALIGWKVVDANNVSIEFQDAGTNSGGWRAVVFG